MHTSTHLKESVITGEKKVVDARGSIANYILPEPINWLAVIRSKKGSVRANHYHPVQEQKLLLIEGKCVSVYKDLSTSNAPIVDYLVHPGDLVVTPPNVAHAVIFVEDSLSINLVKGEREQENFGKHTIPYTLVTPQEAERLIQKHKL